MLLVTDPQFSVLMLSWLNFKLKMNCLKINASVTKRRGFKRFAKELQTLSKKLRGWISQSGLQSKQRVVDYQQW